MDPIDEVAIWNRALSDGTNNGTINEVLELYRRGANRVRYQIQTCPTPLNVRSFSKLARSGRYRSNLFLGT